MKTLQRPPVAFAVVLCSASLLCEVMHVRADAAIIEAHQARWDCLAQEKAKVTRCVALTKTGPLDDADFCEEAVARCKAKGTYEEASKADEREARWFRFRAWLRMAVLVAAVGSLVWVGIIQPIRRRLRTT